MTNGRWCRAEAPASADLVLPIPDSGTPAAIGFARASGIPFSEGLIKNRYVGRTFIQPDQGMRQLGVHLKFNPVAELAGKRVVIVDDSIVRGNTMRQLVSMLVDAGAAEVHVRISSPPVVGQCFYGIDLADPECVGAADNDEATYATGISGDNIDACKQDCFFDRMRDKDDGLLCLIEYAEKLLLHDNLGLRIERTERLVHEHDRPLHDQRACQGHTLTHASRQLPRQVCVEAGEPNRTDQRFGALIPLRFRDTLHLKAERNVVDYAAPGKQIQRLPNHNRISTKRTRQIRIHRILLDDVRRIGTARRQVGRDRPERAAEVRRYEDVWREIVLAVIIEGDEDRGRVVR